MNSSPRRLCTVLALVLVAIGSAWLMAAEPDNWPPVTPYPSSGYPGGGYSPVPDAPDRPIVSSRPASWPGGPMGPVQPATAVVPGAMTPLGQPQLCEGAQILGRVGSEVILMGDVMPAVNEMLVQKKDRIPASDLDQVRLMLVRQQLSALIEIKLIYLDAKRTIPAENFPKVEESLGKQFDDVEIKSLLKRAGVDSRQQLEIKLRRTGSSLEREKRTYAQKTLAQQWIRQQLKLDDEITHEQMLGWYQQHLTEFDRPARARWEEIMVRTAKYPSRAEGYAAIARMGNQVMTGTPFAEVAKAGSDGSTAAKGGRREWTTKGSLRAEVLDQAVFGLPVGQLSPILESDTGYHIIRVTEREDAGRKSFSDAQVDIRDKIRQERTKKQLQEYVDKLRQRIAIWTVFDQDPGAVKTGY